MAEKPRSFDSDIDLMRLLAAYFVVVIHATGAVTPGSALLTSLARFSVPLFVIISGYFMLRRPPEGRALANRILRLLALMLFWSAIYYLYFRLCGQPYAGLRAAAVYLLTQPVHLWYLYAAAVLYLFTPVFFVFAENAGRRLWQYCLALCFFFGAVVTMLLRTGWFPTLALIVDKMKLPYLLGFPFLYLLGGYVYRFSLSPRSRRMIYLLGALGAAATAAAEWLLCRRTGVLDPLPLSFFSPGAILPAMAVFTALHYGLQKRPLRGEGTKAALHEAAGCTLGAYLVHPLLLDALKTPLLLASLPQGLALALRALAVYLAALVLSWLFRRIPILRRLCT